MDTAENGQSCCGKVLSPEGLRPDLHGYADAGHGWMYGGCEDPCAAPRQDVGAMPIIAMTANAFADDRQKTRDAGMNGHLAKPLDMEQLQLVLEKWLST